MRMLIRPVLAFLALCFCMDAAAQCPVAITPAPSMTTCAGSPWAIQATVGSGYLYQWEFSSNGTTYNNIVGATNDSYVPQTNGYYRVVVSTPGNCTTTSNTTQVTIQPLPVVTVTPGVVVCPGTPVCGNSSIPMAGYQWYYNGSAITGATNPCFTPNPNSTGYYQVRAVTIAGCTGISPQVQVGQAPPVINSIATASPACPGAIVVFNANVSGATGYSWSGPNGFTSTQPSPVLTNATLNMAGVYTLIATNNCGSDTDSYNLALTCADSVYPGDVNYDFAVNSLDALSLSLVYGTSGPARSGASTNWAGQWCASWSNLIPWAIPFVNGKHGDCNGDGTVTLADTAAISLNYSLTHTRPAFAPQQKITGLPDLYFDLTGIQAYPGATLSVPVMLGSAASPMVKITGLAARLEVDGMQLTAEPTVQAANSGWLGAAPNLLSFTKSQNGSNGVDWALARIDHHTASGGGVIGYLHFQVPVTASNGQSFTLRFRDVYLVDSSGKQLGGYNVLTDSAQVTSGGVNGMTLQAGTARIVPNPSSGAAALQFQLRKDARVALIVRDMSGRQVVAMESSLKAGAGSVVLPSDMLAPGSYLVGLLCDGVMAETVRWVKLR